MSAILTSQWVLQIKVNKRSYFILLYLQVPWCTSLCRNSYLVLAPPCFPFWALHTWTTMSNASKHPCLSVHESKQVSSRRFFTLCIESPCRTHVCPEIDRTRFGLRFGEFLHSHVRQFNGKDNSEADGPELDRSVVARSAIPINAPSGIIMKSSNRFSGYRIRPIGYRLATGMLSAPASNESIGKEKRIKSPENGYQTKAIQRYIFDEPSFQHQIN